MCDFTKICKKYDPEICDDVETLGEASVCLEEKQSPQAEQATASCLSELLTSGVDKVGLLPCPFCGGIAKSQCYVNGGSEHGNIYCVASCHISPVLYFGRQYPVKSEKEAIEQWNTRAS